MRSGRLFQATGPTTQNVLSLCDANSNRGQFTNKPTTRCQSSLADRSSSTHGVAQKVSHYQIIKKSY